MSKIDLGNIKYQKDTFKKIINTEFNELILPVTSSSTTEITQEEFFDYYQKLFYDIPIEGELNSHKFLIKQSTEYVGVEQNNDEIDLLLDEINQLRTELLEARQVIDTLTQ
jgi:hypothetical protein